MVKTQAASSASSSSTRPTAVKTTTKPAAAAGLAAAEVPPGLAGALDDMEALLQRLDAVLLTLGGPGLTRSVRGVVALFRNRLFVP